MNRFRTGQGQCRANLHKRGLAQSPFCDCGLRQTMNHIIDMCPLTKFEGGLNLLHEAVDDAVIRLHAIYSDCSTREIITAWSASVVISCNWFGDASIVTCRITCSHGNLSNSRDDALIKRTPKTRTCLNVFCTRFIRFRQNHRRTMKHVMLLCCYYQSNTQQSVHCSQYIRQTRRSYMVGGVA